MRSSASPAPPPTPATCGCPGMLHARVLRSPASACADRAHRRDQGSGAPGRQGDHHARELPRRGRAGTRRAANLWQASLVPPLFNNPVRFWGDAVAAVAAVDPHVAEDAHAPDRGRIRTAAVRPRSRRCAEPTRRRSIRTAICRRTRGNQRQPDVYRAATSTRASHASRSGVRGQVHSSYINNAQIERRVSVASWDGRCVDAICLHAGHLELPGAHGDRPRDARPTKSA